MKYVILALIVALLVRLLWIGIKAIEEDWLP
jgi:hypothetical protein